MTVLKQYNTSTSTWETIVVGQPGEAGIVNGTVAPADTSVLWMDTADTASQVAVPSGGTAGQVLAKTSGTDYATGWVDHTGNTNVLINGGMDIWQRGTSFTFANGASGVTADRWVGYGNGASATYSQQTFTPGTAPVSGYEGTYFLRHTTSTGGFAYLEHKIENVRTLAGQTVTFSFWAKAASAFTINLDVEQNFGSGGSAWVQATSTNFNITTSWARYSVTFNMPSITGKTITTTSHSVNAILSTAGTGTFTFDIWGVQLEAGSVATPFKRSSPTLQAELAACQRYYYRQSSNSSALYANFGNAFADSTTTALVQVKPPVTMRAAPSSLEFANLNLTTGATNHGVSAATFLSVQLTADIAVVYVTTSGLTQFRPYNLTSGGVSTSYVALNAEL